MKKRILSFLVIIVLSIGCIPAYAQANNADPVEAFVERLYTNILQRNADATGLKEWTDVLKSGEEQGAKVAQGFIDSPEFKSRNLTNQEYLTILYRTFFNREPDNGGLSAWLQVLDDGLSKMHVFKGFAESNEFTKICENYGIIRGNVSLTEPMDQNEGVTKFIVRCYRLCLGRNADESGLNSWCRQILNGANTAKEAAYGFIFSNEFQVKNLSNEDFVKTMYRVFMDREADSAGLSSWINVLTKGQSRWHVFNGFADSVEFQRICSNYGIASGSGVVVGTDPGQNTQKPGNGSHSDTNSDTVTTGERNALKKAQDYLDVMAFSYSGLVEQLEFDGFTTEEATYAADHCGADWNKQALLKALSYLDVMAFSYSGLIEQLEFDGFTSSQALYAVERCGADWNEQAAKKARSYLEVMSFSKQRLIEQLEFDGFTHEQAVYGVEQNGY